MNDENIKEILEFLEDDNRERPFGISKYDLKVLKDYITNLQQENEFLKLNNPEMNIEHFRIVKENKRKIDNLRKENKELKAIAEEHKNCTRKHWQEKCGEHHAKELIYKSRCEKAIEFIENAKEKDGRYDSRKLPVKVFLNILNGSDENE